MVQVCHEFFSIFRSEILHRASLVARRQWWRPAILTGRCWDRISRTVHCRVCVWLTDWIVGCADKYNWYRAALYCAALVVCHPPQGTLRWRWRPIGRHPSLQSNHQASSAVQTTPHRYQPHRNAAAMINSTPQYTRDGPFDNIIN